MSFRPDLYRGTADYYDRFRLAYPDTMLADLVHRTSPSGHGRLLDLACGTGQLAFPLRAWFAEVWAVDAEADMGDVVRAKAGAGGEVADAGAGGGGDAADAKAVSDRAEVGGGVGRVRAVTAKAEDLEMDAGSVELVVIGNAFHRLPRDLVARCVLSWLEPGGHLALCWSTSPWAGPLDWQQAFGAVLRRWQEALGATSRVPSSAEQRRRTDPDGEVLRRAGFEPAVRHEFAVEHRWTLGELAGHVRSTSFLPPSVLADRAAEFDGDLMAVLSPYTVDGHLTETVSFAYDLARKPGVASG
ncbi:MULTISPECIES: bifunctional 2-polyprenyl-6-hydroxyphenol methylase/3-demethylubiquinol 3-O-methyltransferase UbiG [unclassified Streptomyces]|uniref:class I SAM-dependent methyltransferase n=1 Tax=unclassified Streptomyces TaxID=2593676 RepID=UPI0013A703AD|nr:MULTISPECIES: class I SAM-dependent methyltransferase [unclassified Streptomyces]QZZ31573.1 class I SAM-dependent methyltransferase [Streptomyces sp. ST1015]